MCLMKGDTTQMKHMYLQVNF
uniref:Uncharacterized protein n=1 Tax=Arundo donax TaxID=35708 RepID=A0A0A9A8L3_ARUDO